MFLNEGLDMLAEQYPQADRTIDGLRRYTSVYNNRIGRLLAFASHHQIPAAYAVAMVRQYGVAIHKISLRRLASFPCPPERQLTDFGADRRIELLQKFADMLVRGPLPDRKALLKTLGISLTPFKVWFSTTDELVVSAYDYALAH